MPIRVDTAAKYICELMDWSVSNLPLQKLLYLAQVAFAEANDGAPLTSGRFQAWDYGPIVPQLYNRLKIFGADEVDADVFYDALRLREGSPSRATLDRVVSDFGEASPGRLVELTHWSLGAWAYRYEPGARGIAITQDDIAREARNRSRYRIEWDTIAATSVPQDES